jgi:hypothetical protein
VDLTFSICFCAAVQSVYLGILSRDNMQKLFLAALKIFGLEVTELPHHVQLLLDYIDGIPRRCQLLFSALALSEEPDTFFKGALKSGLRFHEEQPHRLCLSPCCITVLSLYQALACLPVKNGNQMHYSAHAL